MKMVITCCLSLNWENYVNLIMSLKGTIQNWISVKKICKIQKWKRNYKRKLCQCVVQVKVENQWIILLLNHLILQVIWSIVNLNRIQLNTNENMVFFRWTKSAFQNFIVYFFLLPTRKVHGFGIFKIVVNINIDVSLFSLLIAHSVFKPQFIAIVK